MLVFSKNAFTYTYNSKLRGYHLQVNEKLHTSAARYFVSDVMTIWTYRPLWP